MSVVVRMEMPESCKKCKATLCLWVIDDCEIVDTIAAVQDFRKKNDDGFPVFCPIICSLPEGHGRLVDADVLKPSYVVTSTTTNSICHLYVSIEDINFAPTIVPAERSET